MNPTCETCGRDVTVAINGDYVHVDKVWTHDAKVSHIDDTEVDIVLDDGTLVPLATDVHVSTADEIRRVIIALEVAAGTAHLLGNAPQALALEAILASARSVASSL